LPKGRLQLSPIPAENMPANVVNAVLSIEDRRFYDRGAIDIRSVVRAFLDNFQAGHVVAGGSTITQQLAKTLYLRPDRTYKRKIQEAALAFWLERHLTKNQILTIYLNNVYLGSGATGFPAAAKLYFGKQVGDLSLSEAAMLAGMINAPSKEDPLRNLGAARNRAAAVIDAMVANGKITQAAALEARLNPATPNPTQLSPPAGGWFADWIYRSAAAAIPAHSGAVTVHTTLDLPLQQLASNVIESTLATEGRKMHATQAALIAMRPDGAVLAMVGGRDYSDSEYNRATQAKRQPGSVFKLFDYYAALRHGYTPESTVLDEPIDIKGWRPEDDARHYHGRVKLAEAFAHSYNAAAVRLAEQVGIPQVIAAARDLGLRGQLANNPSLALGTSEVTLLDLTSAYAAVRAGAAPVEPWGIASVSLPNEDHPITISHSHEPQHSLGQYQSELIALLRGVVEHGTGRAAALPGFAAGKTGTAQDYRDAWFVGFNDSLVVGVWVGNDDHSPMQHVTGGSLPAMIWKRFMEQAKPTPMPDQTVAQPAMVVAQQKTNEPAPAPAPIQKPQEPETLFNQNTAGAAGAKCNIPVCERSYRSFRASDCTYQPDAGGPRRFCDRQSETIAAHNGANEYSVPAPSSTDRANARRTREAQQSRAPEQKPNGRETAQNTDQDKETTGATPAGAGGTCNIAACRGYSSFRASDCTYQPFGGGPRRVCGRQNGGQDERTAGRPRRERDAERTAGRAARERDDGTGPYYDSGRDDSFAESPGRDGPFGRSPPGGFFGLPLFDRGNDGW
jgi:1A family penicillin-binding protein